MDKTPPLIEIKWKCPYCSIYLELEDIKGLSKIENKAQCICPKCFNALEKEDINQLIKAIYYICENEMHKKFGGVYTSSLQVNPEWEREMWRLSSIEYDLKNTTYRISIRNKDFEKNLSKMMDAQNICAEIEESQG